MQQTCTQCGSSFDITPDDLAFYDKVSPVFNGKKELIPPPSLCPECREQRRLVWRNTRSIYRRTCDHCHVPMIAQYTQDAPHRIFCQECFWSDQSQGQEYGCVFDPSLPLFDQFATLLSQAPLPALINTQTENAEFCHRILNGRNCYLSFIALDQPEDLLYSYYTLACKSCTDVSVNQYCELCFETVDAERCYGCLYGTRIRNCRDSAFLEDCSGCSNCFGCKNLHQKQYHIFNQQKTKEEYAAFMSRCVLDSRDWMIRMQKEVAQFFLSLPCRSIIHVNAEACSGSYIFNSRHCEECFDIFESEHLRFCLQNERSQWCQDICGMGGGSFSYEGVSVGNDPFVNVLFCASALNGCSDCLYCNECYSCRNCMACVGLKRAEYCILNKQYTKEEYEALVPKIIKKMRTDAEWGEFFPAALSPFAYNETEAVLYHPLTKDDALARSWRWRDQTDEMPKVDKIIPAAQLPDSIDDIPDDILNWAIECDVTKRPFKIIKQELEFYRQMRLPVPRYHPDERHRRRMALRNPRKLWKRECMQCGKGIETSYSPDRPEIVYCESCYLASVY